MYSCPPQEYLILILLLLLRQGTIFLFGKGTRSQSLVQKQKRLSASIICDLGVQNQTPRRKAPSGESYGHQIKIYSSNDHLSLKTANSRSGHQEPAGRGSIGKCAGHSLSGFNYSYPSKVLFPKRFQFIRFSSSQKK